MSSYPNFIIQKIDIDDVLQYPEKYNSNNHWSKNENGEVVPPDDYKNKIKMSNTSHWIDRFRTNYKTITIDDPKDLNWMIAASKISSKTGKFTNLFADEMDNFLKKNKNKYSEIFDGTGYFVKSEDVSFKYGQHGIGPYRTLEQIIQSVVSCIDGHKPLHDDTTVLKLYLLDWVVIDKYNEFRIFVHNKQITAVSQQHIYNVFPNLNNDNENILRLKKIYDYFENNIKNVITHIDSYVYDFVFINDYFSYFIEMCSFGKEYAAGSALFHWLLDEDILYGKYLENGDNTIYFRYTTVKNY